MPEARQTIESGPVSADAQNTLEAIDRHEHGATRSGQA
jgi:hypothetical protein